MFEQERATSSGYIASARLEDLLGQLHWNVLRLTDRARGDHSVLDAGMVQKVPHLRFCPVRGCPGASGGSDSYQLVWDQGWHARGPAAAGPNSPAIVHPVPLRAPGEDLAGGRDLEGRQQYQYADDHCLGEVLTPWMLIAHGAYESVSINPPSLPCIYRCSSEGMGVSRRVGTPRLYHSFRFPVAPAVPR